MDFRSLPKQPTLFYSYFDVGKYLYISLILFIIETWLFWAQFDNSLNSGAGWLITAFWFGSVLFAFTHIFLVLMDGWSRFQNYKRIKDHIFQHGFTDQIAWHYKGSRCQRRAVVVAARELGVEQKAHDYFATLNVKYYHILPYFMIKDPLFLFRKYFWARTFLEKHYEPKFDFRQRTSKLHYNAYRK